MYNLQVLVATMNQKDFSKINEMKIFSDVVFANQANDTKYEELYVSGHLAKMITTTTRGVGCNRNIALNYSDGDILLIADDDMVYNSNYAEAVIKAFQEIPAADAIIFNIDSFGRETYRRKNTKIRRVRYYNALNYGAVRIAVKRNTLLSKNISFSLCFGGGTIYSSGEDSLFIWDMLKKGMRVYTHPFTIATVDQTTSTWFVGFTHKYFYDKGALYCALTNKIFAKLLCIQDLIRHRNMYKESGLSFMTVFGEMNRGVKGYRQLIPYSED